MWSLLWILPGLIILLLSWLLLAPIHIGIDTEKAEYQVRIPGLLKFWIDTQQEKLKPRLRILFFSVQIGKKGKSKKKKKTKQKRTLPAFRKLFAYARAAIRSFRVRRFSVDLDTGDVVDNAELHALIYPMQEIGIDLRINFVDYNRLILHLQSRGYRLAYHMTRAALKK